MMNSSLTINRQFCALRQSMHFFVSNLLYYLQVMSMVMMINMMMNMMFTMIMTVMRSIMIMILQVDVVDSEYAVLMDNLQQAMNFHDAAKAHKQFLSAVLRSTMVDNAAVQENIEKMLHVCLRFLAVCALMKSNSDGDYTLSFASGSHAAASAAASTELPVPVLVPSSELTDIHEEYVMYMSVLFQSLAKMDNRGFLFRLDFNGHLSALIAHKTNSSSSSSSIGTSTGGGGGGGRGGLSR